MTQTPDAELVSVARELYAHPPAEFIATRNARAAATRRAGDRELATAVKALPKASVAAWAVGAVAREHPEDLDALGQLGAELRVAQVAADPAELRALSRRRRELTGAVTRTAARLAEERGVGLSGAAQEQVEATWSAVVIDRDAERAVRSLLLVRALEPSGGLEDALAVAGAVETAEPEEEPAAPARPARRIRPAAPARKDPAADDDDARPRRAISRRPRGIEREEEPEEQTPPRRAISRRPRRAEPDEEPDRQTRPDRAVGRTRRKAPEPTPGRADTAREVRRAERELRARERVAEHARTELDDAAEELSRIEAQVLQAAARTEELRRELERLEEQLAELDEERAQATEEREDAEAREEAARHTVEEARRRLAELTD
ncbi:hypothetical protein [Oceanitalea stevensii]|uniref:Transposase n=1 Tax=Oceanitalea stevensii TaxID=2763072 RepID=A0ABR8Z1V7_9MICO|nr:hypothetical protein [Oceanitalea stevensii]MBD8062214.1 hypothetical protein [Oceanitalea stevensii]